MQWIKSAGGPLVCIERKWLTSWLGIEGNSVANDQWLHDTDYTRACEISDYIGEVELPQGQALILGDMPLETSVWYPEPTQALILRLFYKDPEADVSNLLLKCGVLDFKDSVEVMNCEITFGSLAIFDSAFSGKNVSNKFISLDIPVGDYIIHTKIFEPDDRTSVLVHKFELT